MLEKPEGLSCFHCREKNFLDLIICLPRIQFLGEQAAIITPFSIQCVCTCVCMYELISKPLRKRDQKPQMDRVKKRSQAASAPEAAQHSMAHKREFYHFTVTAAFGSESLGIFPAGGATEEKHSPVSSVYVQGLGWEKAGISPLKCYKYKIINATNTKNNVVLSSMYFMKH